jgi:hypothetical protein
MKFDLEKAIKSCQAEDGALDIEKLKGLIDEDYVNPIVAKQKPKFDEKAESEFIASLGIENVSTKDQLVNHVNQTVDEAKTQFNELKSKYDKVVADYETTSSSFNKLNGEMTEYKRKDLLRNDHFNGDVDYALYLINKEVTEEKPFETVYEEFKKSNPKNFAPNQVSTMGTQVGKTEPNQKQGWEAILEDKYPELKT